MEFTTKSELKAAYDAEIREEGIVQSYSELLPALMLHICGKVPSEITSYLNGEPEASVLKKVMKALCSTFNSDEVLAVFQKAVSESQAARP